MNAPHALGSLPRGNRAAARARCGAIGFALFAATCASGCISIEAPAGFLEIHRSTDELRLITPDEAKLWIREFDDDDEGDLAFWSKALENDFVENRGYTLLETGEVTDHAGREGRQWRFEASAEGEAHGYLLTLYVIPGFFTQTIRVAEFAAPKERFERDLAAVREAVTRIRP